MFPTTLRQTDYLRESQAAKKKKVKMSVRSQEAPHHATKGQDGTETDTAHNRALAHVCHNKNGRAKRVKNKKS